MPVPRLPNMHEPKPRAPLPKIALEEAYAHHAGVKLTDKGEPDWAWFMAENALNKEYMEVVAPRLQDFDHTRLQAMEESGIDYIVNSLVCPGIERILDKKEAEEAAAACNDFLASKIKQYPDKFGGFAAISLHDPEAGAAEWSAVTALSHETRRGTGTVAAQAAMNPGPYAVPRFSLGGNDGDDINRHLPFSTSFRSIYSAKPCFT